MNNQNQKKTIDTAVIFENTSSQIHSKSVDAKVDSATKDREQEWKDKHAEQASAQRQKEKEELHALRKKHARRLFKLICFWIAMLWILLFIAGFCPSFKLDSSVIIAAITSTTASVLGLYGIAAYWMFGKKALLLQDGNSQDI